MPFRETHHISGAAVKMSEDKGVPLDSLTPADLRTLHDAFEDDVQEVWNYETRFVSCFVFAWFGLGWLKPTTARTEGRDTRILCTVCGMLLTAASSEVFRVLLIQLSTLKSRPPYPVFLPVPAPPPPPSVERKNSPGGTSRSSVTEQIKTVRDYVASLPSSSSSSPSA